jgi:Capsular polysaccharide biosynthesis protein
LAFFILRKAFHKLRREFGEDLTNELEENAKSIINGDFVWPHELQSIKSKKIKWGLF